MKMNYYIENNVRIDEIEKKLEKLIMVIYQ
jgi:hypothetical protein